MNPSGTSKSAAHTADELEREAALAAWDTAESALQRANAFNVADLYAATLAARRRAMAAGIDVLSQLRG